jgi:site-specific recombinase XerD
VNWKFDDRKYFLFPSSTNNQEPVKTSWIATIFRLAKKKAGITKPGGPHLARHCYATHLMESGVDIRIVQLLLGHSQMSSTAIYTQLRQDQISKIPNPLDQIADKLKYAS